MRRGALLTLNCIAHSRPATLREPISGGELLPLLYGETAKRAELVHQVDLGPFKHFVDDGLELRKAQHTRTRTKARTQPIRFRPGLTLRGCVWGCCLRA